MLPTFKFSSLDTTCLSTILLHYTLFTTPRATMQSIAEDYASDDASSTSNMSVSSYSLASNASTPPLHYPVELPNISTLRFAKVEDHETENKDKPILSHGRGRDL